VYLFVEAIFVFVNSIKQFTFVMTRQYVLFDEGNELLRFIYINLFLQRFKADISFMFLLKPERVVRKHKNK